MSFARPHYLRWVRGGVLVVTVGYALSGVTSLATSPTPIADGLPELLVTAVGLVGLGLLLAGRVTLAAWMVLAAVWLEIHHGFFHAGSLNGPGVIALPAFVIGAGLFAGGRVVLKIGAISANSGRAWPCSDRPDRRRLFMGSNVASFRP